VAKVANIDPFMTLLERIVTNEHEIKIINKTQIKIQTNTSAKYILIAKELQARNRVLYLQNKGKRSFRVVLKNMHHSTNPEVLKQAIDSR